MNWFIITDIAQKGIQIITRIIEEKKIKKIESQVDKIQKHQKIIFVYLLILGILTIVLISKIFLFK